MKRKIIVSLLIVFCLFLTGCSNTTNADNNGSNNNEKKLDHKVYKYVKVTTSSADNFFNYISSIFGWLDVVSYADDEYNPYLIVESDTTTGKAKKATIYSFFLDYSDDEWVDKALESYEEASSKSKKDILKVEKGRINEQVTYIKIEVNPESYSFEQYIKSYILDTQDIEKYNNETFYDNLYNYNPKPVEEKGDNYFKNPLTSMLIEWSDTKFTNYSTKKKSD